MSQASDSALDAASVAQDASPDLPNTPVVSPVAHTEELAAADALLSFRHQGTSTPAEDQENIPPESIATESEANGSAEQYVSISDLRLAPVASGIPLVCANPKA